MVLLILSFPQNSFNDNFKVKFQIYQRKREKRWKRGGGGEKGYSFSEFIFHPRGPENKHVSASVTSFLTLFLYSVPLSVFSTRSFTFLLNCPAKIMRKLGGTLQLFFSFFLRLCARDLGFIFIFILFREICSVLFYNKDFFGSINMNTFFKVRVKPKTFLSLSVINTKGWIQ